MEVTTLSTKGQIVLPQKLRENLDIGTSFSVTKVNDLIVLRPITGLNSQEEAEIKELSKIWKEIDAGKAKTYSESDFFTKMKKW